MSTHTIDNLPELLPGTVQRFRVLFDRFGHDLDSALERANQEFSTHMPSKGDVCEAAVRKYLSECLGSRYAIAEGAIFDSTGTQSAQQDVIVFDDHWSIRLTPKESGEPSMIPVESVYATIEVKKTLSSGELRSAIDNVRSFKSLKREQIGPSHITPNKKINNLGFPGKVDVRNPFFSAIFAFTAGRSMKAVAEQLKREVNSVPAEEWPDVIVVYKEGVILPFCTNCNTSATHISKILEDGHTPSYLLDILGVSYTLLGFHLLLIQHLHYTILGSLNFNEMYAKLAYVARQLEAMEQNKSGAA